MSKVKEYQDWTRTTAIYMDSIKELENKQWNMNTLLALLYLSSGLGGEAGEVQNLIKKVLRDGYTDELKKKISDELGDVLWYVARLCATLGLDMEEVMQYNREKLEKRKAEDKLKGSGDNR